MNEWPTTFYPRGAYSQDGIAQATLDAYRSASSVAS